MKYLLPEIDNNAASFAETIPTEIAEACASGLDKIEGFRASYRLVIPLQAWRDRYFERNHTEAVSSLFLEAQNDALLSIVLAHMAMWRPALQSLRSCLENVLNSCYYADHPIELLLWEKGEHRMTFSELATYFSRHPNTTAQQGVLNALDGIRSEHSVLSKGVHASARSFHMTKGGAIRITHTNDIDYNKWKTRHASTLLWLNVLLLDLHSDILVGAQNIDLRKSISLAVPNRYHSKIAKSLKIHLFSTNLQPTHPSL